MNKQKFFYLQQNGKIFGPLPAAQLMRLYRSDSLAPDDMISFDKENWKNALEFFNGPAKKEVTLKFDDSTKIEQAPSHVEEMLPDLCDLDMIKEEKPVEIIRLYSSMRMFCIIFSILFFLTFISGSLLWLCTAPPPASQKVEEKTAAADNAEQQSASEKGE